MKCIVDGCDNINIFAKGYCVRHYMQVRRTGGVMGRTKFDKNKIVLHKDYAEIILYDNKHKEKCRTKIDLDDINKIKNIRWSCHGTYCINKKIGLLHRLIMDTPRYMDTDHINHNGLDNRKRNLRIVTTSQNLMNKKSNGYSYHKQTGKWESHIKINGKKIHLGLFVNKNDAIETRKKAEVEYFGEYRYVEELQC